MQQLTDLVYSTPDATWPDRAEQAFDALFGSRGGRYSTYAQKKATTRAPSIKTKVPFAALIHPSNPDSGAYGGMSFVVFPQAGDDEDDKDATDDKTVPALFGLVLGTQGLSPDEQILSKPGHARKAKAICAWLNRQFGDGQTIAWAKQDPVRIDQQVPDSIKKKFADYSPVFDRYGGVLYAIFQPTVDREATDQALKAMLDLYFEERDESTLAAATEEAQRIREAYFAHLLPDISQQDVAATLQKRRYVVLQGPPGTGKTRLALKLLGSTYADRGRSIQFHPNTTYEDFIGGLAPVETDAGMGFRFQPKMGHLMKAAEEARQHPDRPYLLHIDEINRTDLAKVLGESVFLLEFDREEDVAIDLPYDFGGDVGKQLSLPDNLHILGTMNTADRSIAILDVAIRRRFAFASLWPQLDVVRAHGSDLMVEKFQELLQIFVEHATDDGFHLLPGHSYFLAADDDAAGRQALKLHLLPLLAEYIAQGYVAGFEEEIRSYMQSLENL